MDFFFSCFPFTWRYWEELPRTAWRKTWLPSRYLEPWFLGYVDREDGTGVRTERWIDRTAQWRENNIRHYYPSLKGRVPEPSAVDPRQKETICKIKEICARHGIRFILYAAPLTSDNPHRVHAAVHAASAAEEKRLLDEMGVEFYDFSAFCPDEWFFDCHHLSEDGAAKFTAWFYANVLKQ